MTSRKTSIFITASAIMLNAACAWPRGSVTARRMLNDSGTGYSETVTYHDGLGRPVQTMQKGLNTAGIPVFTVSELNPDGTEAVRWLPFSAAGTTGRLPKSGVASSSASCHSDSYAMTAMEYDALGRLTYSATAGEAWHSASKGVARTYSANKANSVRMFQADASGAGIVDKGYRAACSLRSEMTTDEDGLTVEVFTDGAGRTILERRGGDHDTYYVYNGIGQLRFILQPMYAENPDISLFAFEYRYDEYGNTVYRSIPGGGYTQYWYDRARRMTFMQDGNLRAQGQRRFFLYDRFGRLALQGVVSEVTPSLTVNTAEYTGGAAGFMQTGYTLSDPSQIRQASLEVVNYYDSHAFAGNIDSQLVRSGTADATGRQTGSIVYASDGSRSVSAVYYDIRGNVIESRELTNFGTLRTAVSTYTFTGQPLTSTVTEGTVKTVTEHTYDPSSALLTDTYVTVNGTKQRIAHIEYDDLGRISSVKRGHDTGSGGKVSYTYNIHGQTSSITGPGFSQNLYYTEWRGTKRYNGSVTAMRWTMDTSRMRGYTYAYNAYGWLTSAVYGEGSMMTSNRDRYSEKSVSFNRNGGVTAFQRNGLRADGTYGKVDDLTVSYDGNRISSVSDAAPAVTQNGSMDFRGGTAPSAFAYNDFGALVSDEGRGITDIGYDAFGNPVKVAFGGTPATFYVYSATGEKLKATHRVPIGIVPGEMADIGGGEEPSALGDPVLERANNTYEYHGNVIHKNGKVDMVLFPGGYATLDGGVTFHYYTQDYLGNYRAVINGTTGAVEQTVAYYPYGGVIPDLGSNLSKQPYKFGGKELVTANGLNEYDFCARNYYSTVPGFTKPDKMADKYPWLSPYLYCGNNPVNLVDPTGNIIEMPKESTVNQIVSVLWNMQQITNDKLTFNIQDNGTVRISIASKGNGKLVTGTNLVRRLVNSSNTVSINVTNNGENYESSESPADATNGKGSNVMVYFNPEFDPDITELDPDVGVAYNAKRPAYIGLTHELIHADRGMRGIAYNNKETEFHAFTNGSGQPDVEEISKEEAATVGFNHVRWFEASENRIRKEAGLNPRVTYYPLKKR